MSCSRSYDRCLQSSPPGLPCPEKTIQDPGFIPGLDLGPANDKNVADLQDAVRASIGRGCYRSLENLLDFPNAPRRTFSLEKAMESLLETIPLPLGEARMVVFVSRKELTRAVVRASLSQRERKKLRQKSLREFDDPAGFRDLWEILTTLSGRGVPLSEIIGFQFGNHRVSYSSDFCRFRHVMGLADAIHLCMLNLGIRVKFPERIYIRSNSIRDRPFRGLVRFKNGELDQSYILFNRMTTRNRRWNIAKSLLHQFPSGLPEKTYVKMIKESLVDTFCVEAGQERPDLEHPALRLQLFPTSTQARLDRRFSTDRKTKIRFYKNLLESKSLCAPVGDDMIHDAYVKHRKSLCRPESECLSVPEDFLKKLFQYGEEVGEFVEKIYDPHSTRLPNSKATVEKPRHKGGAREALSGHLEIQKGPLYLSLLDGHCRVEPFVLGLFGGPGSGKTTMVSRIVASLGRRLFPDRKGHDLVYSRSCSTDHWDGYHGQPIVVLDDLGQNAEDRSDLVEFEQLISTNAYQLPMAALENKGTRFSSSIVITTSNMKYCSRVTNSNDKAVLEDARAFWRRFHVPILVNKTSVRISTEREGLVSSRLFRMRCSWEEEDRTSPGNHLSRRDSRNSYGSFWRNYGVSMEHVVTGGLSGTLEVVDDFVSRYREHVDFHAHNLTGSWRQTIACLGAEVSQDLPPFYNFFVERKKYPSDKNDVSVSILFPEYPPHHPPRVDAVAIPEPLKVRMITKAEAETKCLQPFQRALFQYLKSKPQFVLTHGVSWGNNPDFEKKLEWIYRIESEIQSIRLRSSDGDLWLSGDYTAATDNFPMSVTNALVEGILSRISHEPTRAWVRYEVSPHRIKYPGETQLWTQTSGQLMGSLLSFPLLCFLNDFIVSESGFEVGKYLINGDDVVALGSRSVIDQWRVNAPKVGLDLSIGKNFVDPSFCCVNSQLFYDGNVQHTGKVSCQTRYGKTLSYCYSESQFYYGCSEEIHREFVRRNIVELRKTPRSLCVDRSHGGLGLFHISRPSLDLQLAKRVFIHDWLKPFARSVAVPGYDFLRALQVPVGIFSDEEMELGGGDPEENRLLDLLLSLGMGEEEVVSDGDLTHSSFLKREKEYNRDENVRPINQLSQTDFSLFPSLGQQRTRTIFVQKGRVGFLKSRIQNLALRQLVDYTRNVVSDPEEGFVEIQRELLDREDPLFSEFFQLGMSEWTAEDFERYEQGFPDLPETIHPGHNGLGMRSQGLESLLLPSPITLGSDSSLVDEHRARESSIDSLGGDLLHLASVSDGQVPLPGVPSDRDGELSPFGEEPSSSPPDYPSVSPGGSVQELNPLRQGVLESGLVPQASAPGEVASFGSRFSSFRRRFLGPAEVPSLLDGREVDVETGPPFQVYPPPMSPPPTSPRTGSTRSVVGTRDSTVPPSIDESGLSDVD
nr:MAG: putative RNA-dependent RNA polymerase [Narnaviridae sp.]